MIDTKEFDDMRAELAQEDEKRERAIAKSREILKESKQIIYALHRGDISTAETLSKSITQKAREIQKEDSRTGTPALQEYVEAMAYLHFIKNGDLIPKRDCIADTESYLMGLCDLTGELMRKAVNEVIMKREENVYKIRELISKIYEEFLKFNLRNSELRKKSDSIKWNLTKVEEIIYTLEIRK